MDARASSDEDAVDVGKDECPPGRQRSDAGKDGDQHTNASTVERPPAALQ